MEKIYKLIDPSTLEVRYIGKTKKDLKLRLYNHIRPKVYNNSVKDNWIRELLNNHQVPIIKLVKEVPKAESKKWECFYIKQYSNKGCKLTNSNKGGGGVIKHTAKAKKAIGKASKERYKDTHPKSIAIEATCIKTGKVYPFDSAEKAVRELKKMGIIASASSIRKVIRGTKVRNKHLRKSSAGFTWQNKYIQR